MPPELNRRSFLGSLAAAGVAATTLTVTTLPAAAKTTAGPVTLDEFMQLSDILTDNEFSLDDDVGVQYFRALVNDPVHAGPLRQLVNDTVRANREPDTFAQVLASGALDSDAAAATAQQILVYWYSGVVSGRTADYLEALAWESVEDFTEPASEKIGFPKWEERP
jgi:hypothetical protein